LPQAGIRYNLNPEMQVFGNIGKNFRAPPNFAFATTGNNIQIIAGVPTLVGAIEAETSVNTDLGYRFQSRGLTFSANAFFVDFRNRQANATDPNTNLSVYTNAGAVKNRGIELEFGTPPVNGLSFYGSFTAQRSKVQSDLSLPSTTTDPVTKKLIPVILPTAGKQFALTPETLAGFSVQYQAGPLYSRLKVKHTGPQKATLMNDESVPSYNTMDFDAGYNLGKMGFFANSQLRFNISNLGNERFRNPTSGTVVNAAVVTGPAVTIAGKAVVPQVNAQNVFYFLGAPRLMTMTLSADF
jgi:iron complex outermembrane recepter protein